MPRTWQLLGRNSTKRVPVFLSCLRHSQLWHLLLTLVDDFSLKQHLSMCAIGATYAWRPCFWKIIALPLTKLNWPTQGNKDKTKSKLLSCPDDVHTFSKLVCLYPTYTIDSNNVQLFHKHIILVLIVLPCIFDKYKIIFPTNALFIQT
jgi:hypothetical protein